MAPKRLLAASLMALAMPAGAVAGGSPDPAAYRAALDEAVRRPEARAEARLELECSRDGRMPSIRIFGRGVGIQDGRRQFRVSPDTVATLLGAVRDADFARWPESFGEGSESDAALKVVCRLAVEVGGLRKQVVQLEGGEPSARLQRLAERIQAACEAPAHAGTEAADLEDGLAKLERGALAPETLEIVLHRKPELNGSGDGRGFLLRVGGGLVTLQDFAPATGYGAARARRFAPGEVEGLAATLAAQRPGRLPANLWADDYVDFELAVLDRRVAVQARRFTGMTPATHGEAQAAFDAVVAALDALRRGFDAASGDHP